MDAYQVLGVSREDSMEEIREKYIKLVKKYHPDNDSAIKNEEILKQINIAYCMIKQEKEEENKLYNSGFDVCNSDFAENEEAVEENRFVYGKTSGRQMNHARSYIEESRKMYSDDNDEYYRVPHRKKSGNAVVVIVMLGIFLMLRILMDIIT